MPDTAAASGTVASTRIWPGWSAFFRFVRFSDCARNGTDSTTIGPRVTASVFSSPSTCAPGTRSRSFSAASAAASGRREPITTGTSAFASRSARPKPSAPVAPTIGHGFHALATLYAPLPMRLEGKTALVTGGGSGIGAATCRRLAAEGAHVAVTDVNLDTARARWPVRSRATRTSSTSARPTRSRPPSTRSAQIDILVNNAGTDAFGFFIHSTPEMWDLVIGVNLVGVLAVTHAVLPGMQERGGGTIINIASEAGRVGSPGSATYSGAKAGVIGFTKAIAQESARYKVRCNAIAPGPIETPLLMAAPEHLGELGERLVKGMVSKTALGRIGRPGGGRGRGRVPRVGRRVIRHRRDDRSERRPRHDVGVSDRVDIREVGPRDGFQNEPEVIPTAEKVRLIEMLARTGAAPPRGHELREGRR